MPSAPPRCASTAAHRGSGSYVRRASRSVATWSMLTPSSITAVVLLFAPRIERLQVLDDAAALDAALLEIVVEHVAHQPFRFGSGLRVDIAAVGERQQRRAAHLRQPHAGRRGSEPRSA